MSDISPRFNLPSAEQEIIIPPTVQDTPGQIVGGWNASPAELSSGNVKIQANSERILLGSASAPLTGVGIFLGKDDSNYEFRAGDPAGNYIHWDGSTLTIVGVITATSGTIGGFTIGSDYLKDSGDTMGLASTVTAGDDVRFWAGASFANRASAPFRVTEAGELFASSATLTGIIKFGGSGADGSLAITSGTTTLDLGGTDYFVKNYTSISITGTGKLAFSNPGTNGTIIVLKSQGNVTLTSSTAPMIDASGMGATGGAAVTSDPGNTGSLGNSILIQTNYGSGGGAGSGTGAGGAGGAGSSAVVYILSIIGKLMRVSCGAGGASGGGNGTNASGVGGTGGGALIIECGGALNFTTASGISVAGINGAIGATSTGVKGGVGGGGGGAGGICAIIYKTLTANSGTIIVTGGNGGNGRQGSTEGGSTSAGGGGGGGGANRYAGGAGGAGGVGSTGGPTVGSNGISGSGTGGGTGGTGGATGEPTGSAGGGGGGGGGAAGNSYVTQNTEFV